MLLKKLNRITKIRKSVDHRNYIKIYYEKNSNFKENIYNGLKEYKVQFERKKEIVLVFFFNNKYVHRFFWFLDYFYIGYKINIRLF